MEQGGARSAGTTLTEVIVTTAIVSTLTGVLLVGLVSSRRASAARQAAEHFAGFLRETATLALSGVRGAGCGQSDPLCYQYRVTATAESAAYARQTAANTDAVNRALPGGASFVGAGVFLFQASPPTLAISFNGTPLSPQATANVSVQHRGGGPVWRVCVTGLGRVSVTAGATC